MDLFVTCGPGIEPLLAQELATLGFPQAVTGFRGVNIRNVNFDAIYKINYCSRLASRVLLPISRFRCTDDRSLYRTASAIDWPAIFKPGKTFAIDANVSHHSLRNSLYAAQVVKDAICDQLREKFGWRPSVDTKSPDIQLNLFVHETTGVLSFDTSGAPLHRRGYRQETVEAPMQETVAASLLTLANYQGSEVLCDPCCGSGTLLIEAALIASKTPPGYLRTRWGFSALPSFSQENWLKVKNEADAQRIPLAKQQIFGIDINKQATHACRVNLRAAGFNQQIEVSQMDVREYTPAVPPNLIVINPPYGHRLEEVERLRSLYRALGDFMKRKSAKPAKGFILTSSPDLAKEVGLAASRRHIVDNGGIDARWLEFDLYEGTQPA